MSNDKSKFDPDNFIHSIKFPEASDRLFVSASDWRNNARLDWSWDKWSAYAEGYKEAAGILVKQIEACARGAVQDTLVYPIVFLYRQYIELAIKALLKDARRLQDIEKEFPTHHRIYELWLDCRGLLKDICPGDSEKELDQITRLIKEFSSIDPDSFAFRYPEDKKGKPSIDGLTHINLRVLRETMEGISNLLSGAHDQISDYLAYKADMRAEHGGY